MHGSEMQRRGAMNNFRGAYNGILECHPDPTQPKTLTNTVTASPPNPPSPSVPPITSSLFIQPRSILTPIQSNQNF